MLLILILLCFSLYAQGFRNRAPRIDNARGIRISMMASTSEYEARKEELKAVLAREYLSFFSPFESSYYRKDVEFLDPLNKLSGVSNYANNVDMLSGRTPIGLLLFKDARINLHSIEEPEPYRLRTRWTLSVCFKILPWQPTPIFSGISDYTLDNEGYVIKQQDYWDSINLENGSYNAKEKLVGLLDFAGQLFKEDEAQSSAQGEVPYELLRRGRAYEIRRYPPTVIASTYYDTRPEGYAKLGSYSDGANSYKTKLFPLSPCLLEINRNDESDKIMLWPIGFKLPNGSYANVRNNELPSPLSDDIVLTEIGERVVAIMKFSDPTTEQFVRYYTGQLDSAVRADGLVPDDSTIDTLFVAQYNAIYSLSKRRNEVWMPLKNHVWQEKGF